MTEPHEDIVIRSLKARFFDLIKKEEIGSTPAITKELDNLQDAIKKLQARTPIHSLLDCPALDVSQRTQIHQRTGAMPK